MDVGQALITKDNSVDIQSLEGYRSFQMVKLDFPSKNVECTQRNEPSTEKCKAESGISQRFNMFPVKKDILNFSCRYSRFYAI